jgi:hypothetical protein
MKDKLIKKSKSLKSAIEKYNQLKLFVDHYNKTHSLDLYIEHLNQSSGNISIATNEHYERMIFLYNSGNKEPLLSYLYDRLLAADDYKNKLAEELKLVLRESCE